MLETDTLRQILQQKAIDCVTALGLATQIGDEPFAPPTDGSLYAEFWFKTGKTKKIELGNRRGYQCTAGMLQFTIYGPEKTGDGPITRMGDQIKPYFDEQQWQVPPDGYVTLDPASVQMVPGVRGGNKVVIVDATFDFYHRNPNATP